MTQAEVRYRYRITFGKVDSLRYIGHLDLAKTWERVMRRADMPMIYSQGFNPQPKMQLASALPLGISSTCELLDVWLNVELDADTIAPRLQAVSPPGLVVHKVELVPLKSPALQTLLAGAEYRMEVDDIDRAELSRRIADVMALTSIERERRGKTYDLRPLILDLGLDASGNVLTHLSLGSKGTARPDELLAVLGIEFGDARCYRIALHLNPVPA